MTDYKDLIGQNNDTTFMNILMRAERAESRVEALEQELLDSARDFARQIAETKLNLGGRGRGYNHNDDHRADLRLDDALGSVVSLKPKEYGDSEQRTA